MPIDFWSIPSINITIILLVIILAVYYIKEWLTNLHYRMPGADKPTAENPYPQTSEIPQVKPPLKKSRKKTSGRTEKKGRVVFGTKNFTYRKGKGNETEVTLTADLIAKISQFGTTNSWMKAIVAKMVPQPALDDLIKLAYEGKLRPGMKVTIKNGYLTLSDEDQTY